MSYMFEVYSRPPADPSRESTLTERVSSFGGRLGYREAQGVDEPGGVCLTFQSEDSGRAQAAAKALRQRGEHVEGPTDYGPSAIAEMRTCLFRKTNFTRTVASFR